MRVNVCKSRPGPQPKSRIVKALTLNMPQQRIDVLADIVIASAFTKVFGHRVVVAEGGGGDLVEIVGVCFMVGCMFRERCA